MLGGANLEKVVCMWSLMVGTGKHCWMIMNASLHIVLRGAPHSPSYGLGQNVVCLLSKSSPTSIILALKMMITL